MAELQENGLYTIRLQDVEINSLRKRKDAEFYNSIRINLDTLDQKVKDHLWKEMFNTRDTLLLQILTIYALAIQIVIFYTVRELAGLTVILVPLMLSFCCIAYYSYRYWWIYRKRPYIDINMGYFTLTYYRDKKVITPFFEPCIVEFIKDKLLLNIDDSLWLYSPRTPKEHIIQIPPTVPLGIACNLATESSSSSEESEKSSSDDDDFTFVGGKK